MQEPEGKDLAGAIWLSISPTLADAASVPRCMRGRPRSVGKTESQWPSSTAARKPRSASTSRSARLKNVLSGYRRKNGESSIAESEVTDKTDENLKNSSQWKLPDTFKLKIGEDTTLSGNKLLTGDPGTMKLVGTILNTS